MNEVIKEVRARRLRYIFACTTEQRAARLFEHLKFHRVESQAISPAKWRGYDKKRIALLTIFRCNLNQ